MATHYGGIGDTSMDNPESKDTDSVSLQHLTCKMEQLRQTVEDKDNDPRDAIKYLEQKLNQLAITLCPPQNPLGSIK